MDNFFNDLIKYITGGFISSGIFYSIIKWIIHNPEKAERKIAWFYRTFNWISKRWDYKNVASNIQANINTCGEKLNKETPGVLPHAMKIDWVKNTNDAQAYLKNGEVIVTIDYSHNQDRNLVVATLAYLEKGLLPNVRPYVDKILMKSTDFIVARNFLKYSNVHSATNYFFENVFKPEIEKNPLLKEDCLLLENLEDIGFFSKIYLRQLKFLGLKLFPSFPNESIKNEIREFAYFLKDIALREPKEFVKLMFHKNKIRVNIMLVARAETKLRGTEAYIQRVDICITKGIEQLYICSRDSDNISLAEEVAENLEYTDKIKILGKYKFVQSINGEDRNALLFVCTLNLLAHKNNDFEKLKIIYTILEENIEELRDDKIMILKIARNPSVKSKVLIASNIHGSDNINCINDEEKIKRIESALNGERIEFVILGNDPKSLIIDSLKPLNPSNVINVETNIERHEAIVTVNSVKAKQKALGYGDQNLKYAMELIDWNIKITLFPENSKLKNN